MKILVLDARSYYLTLAERLGIKPSELVAEAEGSIDDDYRLYRPGPQTLEWIQETVLETSFDIVIVGNNKGAGLQKIPYLLVNLLPKTIVVWHEIVKEDVEAYKRLGVTHFATRKDVIEQIRKIINS